MTIALSIGDFSRMTQLSVKTLRHYHEVGLLEPDRVDPATGYRHYAPEQVPTAQVVRRLRELGMPIAEVRAVLASAPADRNALISGHLERLQNQLAATRSAVETLRAILAAGRSLPHRTPQCRSDTGRRDCRNRRTRRSAALVAGCGGGVAGNGGRGKAAHPDRSARGVVRIRYLRP
ncbi:helix-turn-helix domain-containing protein [Mycobacterium sp.]|uniref:MerR family transcriptional regulator n=1 Tax=Mycobacterium sp. TaxID=1785 RepID=UPI002D06EB11|nr:helix-turn-helix domain-containing protein [Mycobacterium sp.]HTH84541.1 helix-turn-helix domain-containing protein [Mycobacterium sp.]